MEIVDAGTDCMCWMEIYSVCVMANTLVSLKGQIKNPFSGQLIDGIFHLRHQMANLRNPIKDVAAPKNIHFNHRKSQMFI